jgi:succinate dehydrogenase / fumarate reductase cytochrome b subunit
MWETTVGKKIAVAITGAVLLAYVVLHMVGNLNSLYGPGDGEARVDGYAEWLRTFGEPILPHATFLWAVRVLLLVSLAIHVAGVIHLKRRSMAARPAGHRPKRIGRSLSSRTMMVSGLFLLAFVIFHILQFTTLTIDVTPLRQGAVYANLYGAFQKWYFVLLYVLAVAALGMHLRHAVWSATQTLGLDRPERHRTIRRAALVLSTAVAVGFASVPLCIWTGILGRPR